MIISSSFKDYYDGIMKHSSDYKRVYNRRMTKHQVNRKPNNFEFAHSNPKSRIYYHPFYIGFCGEYHLGFYSVDYSGGNIKYLFQDKCIYDKNELFYNIHTNCSKTRNKQYQYDYQYLENNKPSKELFISFNSPILIMFFNTDYFASVEYYYYDTYTHSLSGKTYSDNYDKNFQRLGHRYISLKDMGFNKIKPAEQAYQEIESFNNLLGREYKDVPEMSNQNKINSHGFDKTSFRK